MFGWFRASSPRAAAMKASEAVVAVQGPVSWRAASTLIPATTAGWWPWPLTELTARMVGAWLAATGVTLAGSSSSAALRSPEAPLRLRETVLSGLASSVRLAGAFQVTVTAREGTSLSQMERAVYEEIGRLATEGPTEEELTAAKNGAEASFVMSLASTLGKADRLNSYYTFRGEPDLFNEDLARFRAVTADDVRRVR